MTYSCAIFFARCDHARGGAETKLDLVCQKLALEPGERLLDVGCGWGSLAIHAAGRYGAEVVGITLSEPQAALARRRVQNAGLSEKVEIRVADYRQLGDRPFDGRVLFTWRRLRAAGTPNTSLSSCR